MNTVKPESIALFCLTPGGVRLAKRLAAMLPLTCYTSEALQEEGFIPFNGGFASAAREAFSSFSALIFIGAAGGGAADRRGARRRRAAAADGDP